MSNDLFADAELVEIPTNGATYTSDPVDNTTFGVEDGESVAHSRSAWWKYTPATSGSTTFTLTVNEDVVGDYYYLYLWTGDELESLVFVTSDSAQLASDSASITRSVTANTTYYLAASQSDPIEYTLSVTGRASVPNQTPSVTAQAQMGRPVFTYNDAFADAYTVVIDDDGETYTSPTLTTEWLTVQEGEPPLLDDMEDYRSHWWWYMPASSGEATFDTELSTDDADAIIDLFTGSSLGTLTLLDRASDNTDNGNATLDYTVTAGEPVYIRVYTRTINPFPDHVLRVTGPASSDDMMPAIGVDTTVGVPDFPTNDNFADAADVYILDPEEPYESGNVANVGFTLETGETLTGYRSAWWRYIPVLEGTAVIDTHATNWLGVDEPDTRLHVYTGEDLLDLTEIAYNDDHGDNGAGVYLLTSQVSIDVDPDVTYWIRVSAYSDEDLNYALRVDGPPTVADVVTVTVLPMDVPAEAGAADVIEGSLSVVTPAAGATVPTARPSFGFLVHRTGDTSAVVPASYHIQVRDVSGATVADLTGTEDIVGAVAYLQATPEEDLPDGPYYWNVAVHLGGAISSGMYIPGTTFTVDSSSLAFAVPVSWSVQEGTAPMHLWFLDPGAGTPGGTITVIGHGLDGDLSASVDGLDADIESVTLVPGTGTAPLRTIDPADEVTAEHYEVVVTVPAEAVPPGGQLVLNRAD